MVRLDDELILRTWRRFTEGEGRFIASLFGGGENLSLAPSELAVIADKLDRFACTLLPLFRQLLKGRSVTRFSCIPADQSLLDFFYNHYDQLAVDEIISLLPYESDKGLTRWVEYLRDHCETLGLTTAQVRAVVVNLVNHRFRDIADELVTKILNSNKGMAKFFGGVDSRWVELRHRFRDDGAATPSSLLPRLLSSERLLLAVLLASPSIKMTDKTRMLFLDQLQVEYMEGAEEAENRALSVEGEWRSLLDRLNQKLVAIAADSKINLHPRAAELFDDGGMLSSTVRSSLLRRALDVSVDSVPIDSPPSSASSQRFAL